MRVRRVDVAKLAGTSPSVVSYVLNGGPRSVAPETRARVLAAVEKLNYRPNGVARSLRLKRTMTLGLIVPDTTNPFFGELARGIEDAAFRQGYTLLLGNAHEDAERQTAYVRTFAERQVDGLFVVPNHGPLACLDELERSHVPWVVLDRPLTEMSGVSQVQVDNFAGAFQATNHLIDHGRTAIGCIAGPADVSPAVDRVRGWRAALSSAGQPTCAPPMHVPFGRAAAYRAARMMLADASIDAVFVASDEQALGVLRAVGNLGRHCPDDVAVFGFDGVASSADTTPGLSTVAQPFTLISETAVGDLLERIADPIVAPRRAILETTLVLRGSCGCPDTLTCPWDVDGADR